MKCGPPQTTGLSDALVVLAPARMKTFTVETHRHQLVISTSIWSGQERVTYDGEVKSEKRSFLFVTPHIFRVTEADADVVYEVNLLSGLLSLGYVVRRNGIAVAVSS
jgi:hypothetical protein